ncbi:MAG: gluconate 2-dehydrogenase subunit 3 family protein [Pseudomonadota bacterium]
MRHAHVSRRIFLSSAALSAIGISLAGCRRDETIDLEVAAEPSFTFFDATQSAILLDVADILIPRTDTPGASDSNTILYIDQLMATWAGAETKADLLSFIDQLNAQATARHQTHYLDLSDAQKFDLLSDIDRTSFGDPDDAEMAANYRRLKRLIFHVHYTSEAANSDFVLIPGQYQGDISEAEYAALVEDNRY